MQKLFATSIVLMLCTLGWADQSSAQGAPAPQGEIRIVDENRRNWVWITLNVMEHLMELDTDGMLVPRLATGWRWLNDRTLEVELRRGVTFHNGEVFDAEIVKLNWQENIRLRQPHQSGAYMNFEPGARLESVSPQIVRFIFPEPDGMALAKLSVMHIANRQFYREFGWDEKSW